MSSFRITITELKPCPSKDDLSLPAVPCQEVKVFEQTVENLDVRRFARDFNAPVRKSRAKTG